MRSDTELTQEEQRQILQAFADFDTNRDFPDVPLPSPEPVAKPTPENIEKKQRTPMWLVLIPCLAVVLFGVCIVIAIFSKPASILDHPNHMANRLPTMDEGIAIHTDGTVVCSSGSFLADTKNWQGIISVTSGYSEVYGLRSDGTVLVSGGTKEYRKTISQWTNVVAIAAGDHHLAALLADGTVVAASNDTVGDWGETNTGDWEGIVAISAGSYHTVGLKADGTVVSTKIEQSDTALPLYSSLLFFRFDNGQTDVEEWTDIIAISAGTCHTVGLKADGTVVSTGNNGLGQCDISDWNDISAISAGDSYTLGLKSDGTVVAVGDNSGRKCDVSQFSDVVAISAGRSSTYVLTAQGQVLTPVTPLYANQSSAYTTVFTGIRIPNDK